MKTKRFGKAPARCCALPTFSMIFCSSGEHARLPKRGSASETPPAPRRTVRPGSFRRDISGASRRGHGEERAAGAVHERVRLRERDEQLLDVAAALDERTFEAL